MIDKNIIYAGIGFVLLLYILNRFRKKETNFDREYREILTSEKYKVKGQYD